MKEKSVNILLEKSLNSFATKDTSAIWEDSKNRNVSITFPYKGKTGNHDGFGKQSRFKAEKRIDHV